MFVLGVDFGDKTGFILLTCLVGSTVGISLGTFVGTVIKSGINIKIAVITSATLLLSFMSGLMFGTMQDIIEHNAPIINRINPAALIKDSFYCLGVYDNYTRYTRNVISILIISFIFLSVSIIVMRREKYASL